MENKNKPAYPLPDSKHYTNPESGRGLTKRELFAMAAMQGLCANPNVSSDKTQKDVAQFYASCAINFADELLKQLES